MICPKGHFELHVSKQLCWWVQVRTAVLIKKQWTERHSGLHQIPGPHTDPHLIPLIPSYAKVQGWGNWLFEWKQSETKQKSLIVLFFRLCQTVSGIKWYMDVAPTKWFYHYDRLRKSGKSHGMAQTLILVPAAGHGQTRWLLWASVLGEEGLRPQFPPAKLPHPSPSQWAGSGTASPVPSLGISSIRNKTLSSMPTRVVQVDADDLVESLYTCPKTYKY